MSNANHTPGPWIVEASSVSNSVKIVEDKFRGYEIGSVWSHNPMSSGAQYIPLADVAEANARLIAAAPEFLEALEALCKIQEDGDVVSWADEWDKARSAIAKARGE